MARFEAVFYEGEVDERLPSWDVVEWTEVNPVTGAKFGRSVRKYPGSEKWEAIAKEMAEFLQEEYNQEFYAEFG